MKFDKKLFSLISVLLAVVLVCSAASFALLTNKSNQIDNTFVGGTVGCEIKENVTSEVGVKKNVKLKNTGTVDAYMRACVVVNWVDANGIIYNEAPVAGEDYIAVMPNPTDFLVNGNNYYCKKAVKAGGETPVLFSSITPVEGKAPTGYVLSVEILGSSIQSLPSEDVEIAWGVTVVDNAIAE